MRALLFYSFTSKAIFGKYPYFYYTIFLVNLRLIREILLILCSSAQVFYRVP